MAAADVRDMLDLPADGQQPRPAKKQKLVEKRPGKSIPRVDGEVYIHTKLMACLKDGITRELYSLLGPRAPPISLNENKYKGRRKWMSKVKVKPWYGFHVLLMGIYIRNLTIMCLQGDGFLHESRSIR